MKLRVLIIGGIIAISLIGCGTNKEAKVETPDVENGSNYSNEKAPTQEAEITEVADGIDEEEVIEEASAVEDAASVDDKDTSDSAGDEEILQTNPEDIGGEGIVDESIPDLTGMGESTVGEPVTFTDKAGADLCLFAIESVETSGMKIENMGDVTGQKVVVVSYSYTNKADKGSILFDDMSFKLLADDKVCIPYFSPELTPAASSGLGETAFGQVAFLVPENCKDVIVVFDNTSVNAKTIFRTTVK